METDKKVAVSAEAPEPSQMSLDTPVTDTNGATEPKKKATERSTRATTQRRSKTETPESEASSAEPPAKAAEAPSEVTERSRSARDAQESQRRSVRTEQGRSEATEQRRSTRPEQRRSPRPDRPEQNREPRHENPEQLSKKLGSLATKSYEELLTLARGLSDKGELPPLVNIPAKYRTEPSTPVTEPPGKVTERSRSARAEQSINARRRSDLVMALLAHYATKSELTVGAGILDVNNEGFGFLRALDGSQSEQDIYVGRPIVKRYGLRQGDLVAGVLLPPRGNGRYFSLLAPEVVNGFSPRKAQDRPRFEKFSAVYPNQLLNLETSPKLLATRIIDLISPIGRGQRALIVAPPKAGKTVLLKQITQSISANHPDIHIIVALIGERPEEVTDMRRSVKAEVYSSTFDEPVEGHCHMAEMALDRARRLVESGENVVILLDSLTRLARAYNLNAPSSGKTLSGGMDPVALYPPKKFFGAARNCEDGGSLTIIATTLVDTGSRLDDLIYEEFKGTGNMELHLDRDMANRRIYPAIDIIKSGTRHEELLLDEATLSRVWLLRRMIAMASKDSNSPSDAYERVRSLLLRAKNNAEFLETFNKPGQKYSH